MGQIMTRQQFMGVFLGFIIQRIPSWLPEEATEEMFLEIINKRIGEHSFEIKAALGRVYQNKEEEPK